MKKRKYGFTLIELLATIVIISLILGILSFFIGNVFGGVTDKIDKATKNMILDAVNEYVLEYRNNTSGWKENVANDGTITFCVSLNSLIESGYYDSDDEYVMDNRDKIVVSATINSNKVSSYKLFDYDKTDGVCDYFLAKSEIDKYKEEIDIKDDVNSLGRLEYHINVIDNNTYMYHYIHM